MAELGSSPEKRRKRRLTQPRGDELSLQREDVNRRARARARWSRRRQLSTGPAGQAVPRCQPRSDGPSGVLVSGHRLPSVPDPGWRGLGLGHRRQGCQEPMALGARLAAREEKMLLLSPALARSSGTGCGEGAGACARPRPPGIFERCSWVSGRRGRGGWAGPPNEAGGGWPGGGGGRRKLQRLATQRPPRRTPGARPGPAGPPRGQARAMLGRPRGQAARGVQAAGCSE